MTVSRREHGAHEALSASDKYCYGDALLARFVVHGLGTSSEPIDAPNTLYREKYI